MVPTERENETKELRLNITELEANTNNLHTKFEATLAHLEQEAEDKDAELRAVNEEIEHLGKQVYALEEDADRVSEEHEHLREEEAAEREALEALASALNDVRPFPISPSLPFHYAIMARTMCRRNGTQLFVCTACQHMIHSKTVL